MISIVKALNPAYRQFKPIRKEVENFKSELLACLESIEISDSRNESEEHLKEPIKKFLTNTFYQKNLINTKDRIDLAIYLDESAIKENFEHKGKDYAEAFPDLQQQWEQERTALKKLLLKNKVEVFRPRKLNRIEKETVGVNGYANFFVRDPFFTVGNTVIESSLRFLHRRKEIFPLRDLFKEEIYPINCNYIAVPQPELTSVNDSSLGNGPFLEGGDVVILGKHILVGYSGLASNLLGIEWLRKVLGHQGYIVESIKLHPTILHLDCALGIIKEGLVVLCEEAFLDGIPEVLKNYNKISVSLNEARNLATNGLSISPTYYITDPVFQHKGKR